ncbi:GntR family transcriptional regulator [Roseomonas gilardii]|uniref:GntR family transcriptional regulator n=1 Tax=Roseomonas gilardii TaxID=257708 RepID=UPI0011A2EAAC|nr:GntR family transcriptional regulator [Roseomonas gilardii]
MTESNLDPPQASLTRQAMDRLRGEIIDCRLRPGETLAEGSTAQRLGLGKAPIRAALARLAEEGLVEAVPRRGWVVSLVTIRDIHEVFDLRLLLEPEAARRAAGRVASGDTTLAEARQRSMAAATLVERLEARHDFHRRVATLSGNERLAQQIGRLLDESRRMMLLRPGQAGSDAPVGESLLLAMLEGRAADAARAMHEAVWTSRTGVLAALTAPEAGTVL